ncbi:nucleotidyltransferase family protein [Leptolyngbya sp. AN02str]|uniref:nucleotidyltransferase family protein n=1 Tax=Leptolyngbya sp. AN02str TaxID=3423363 RepID=UPI003D31A20F
MRSVSQGMAGEWIGVIPAGGSATRLQPLPCSKELLPIGFHSTPDGKQRPKVVSQYLLEHYQRAGATKAFFILKPGKWDIPAYYQAGQGMGLDIAYSVITVPYGSPYTLDQVYAFVKEANVMLGFPDILLQPSDAFVQLRQRQETTGADVVLGLFPVRSAEQAQRSDLVAWDQVSGHISQILIKPPQSDLRESWILAVWTPAFTRFMHDFLQRDRPPREVNPNLPELYLGHVFQAAIAHGLKVQAHPFPQGEFLDIGTPAALAEAYHRFGNSYS